MRVGLVIYGSLDTLSGGYLYDRMLVRQLELSGHAVTLLALPWRSYPRHLADNFAKEWTARLQQAPVDVLIQDELNHPSLVWVNRRMAGRVAFRIVSLVHHLRSDEEHPFYLRWLYWWLEHTYLNGVDSLIANSATTLQRVTAHLAAPRPSLIAYPAADHLPAVEPACTPASIAHRVAQAQPLRVLFVGNVIPRKGLHTLVAALAQLDPQSWRLTIVGRTDISTNYVKQIHRQCRRLQIDARLTWLGRVDDAALAMIYRGHDVLAVPSFEGFGIVYLEAMRFGLPVIASTAGAAHEIVTPGSNGYLAPPNDAQGLAKLLKNLTDRDALHAMSLAARSRYEKHPTWGQSMATIVDWLAQMVS